MKAEDFCCITTDHVEPDLQWEAVEYAAAGIKYQALNLRNAPAGDLVEALGDADIIVVDQARISAEVLQQLPRLKAVVRHGDGTDNVDLQTATELGIVVANEPGFWSREVAEHTLMLIFAVVKRLARQRSVASRDGQQPGSKWNLPALMPFSGLHEKTVGVIGFGKIGSLVAGMLGGLAKRVVVYTRSPEESRIRAVGAEPVSFADLLRLSDLISLHVPGGADTYHLIGEAEIQQMQDGAILVNTSRGPNVDLGAVTEALTTGKLAGAGLDTTDPEPLPPDHALFDLDSVIVTPHFAWYGESALTTMRRQIVADVKALRNGITPASVVNPNVLDSDRLRLARSQAGGVSK